MPLFGIMVLALWFFMPNMFVPILPDFRAIYHHIPIWNMFHLYERFLFLGVFSLSALLTLSLDHWSRYPGRTGMLFPVFLFVILSGIVIMSTLFQHYPRCLPKTIYYLLNEVTVRSGGNYISNTKIGSTMSIFLVLSFILVAARVWLRLPRTAFLCAALVILVIDLMHYGLPLKPTLNINSFLSPPKLAQAIPQDKRIICITKRPSWVFDRNLSPLEARRSLGACINLFFGLSEVGGFTWPIFSKEEYQLFNLMLADVPQQGPWHKRVISDSNEFNEVLDLWRLYSIEYLITDIDVNLSDFSLVERDGEYRLYKINGSLPRLRCSSSIDVVSRWEEIMRWITRFRISKPSSCVILDQGFEKSMKLSEGTITSISGGSTTKLTVNVKAGEGGTFLIHADRWTKEWKATIDDKPSRLYRVNGMQRGVFVPAGNHTVCFKYHDIQLIVGLCIAGVSLLIIVIFSMVLIVNWCSKIQYTATGKVGN